MVRSLCGQKGNKDFTKTTVIRLQNDAKNADKINSKKMTKLFQHQKEGIEFLIEKEKAILADSMGLGKSKQAILAAGRSCSSGILIVCPASLKINWKREIEIEYPEDTIAVISGGDEEKAQEESKNAAWIIINYDILGKHEWLKGAVKDEMIEVVIFDEAHYIKDTKAIRTKAALAIAADADKVYCLTGTLMMNRPIELFPILRAIKHPLAYREDKPISATKRDYGKRYCNAFFHKIGWRGGFWDETGAARIPELREMTKGSILRRTKEEVLDLPEKLISVVPMALNEEWQARYNSEWDMYLKWVAEHPEGKNIGNILDAQAMIKLGKLKQVCSQAKVKQIVEDVANSVEQGEKVIVFSQFTETINQISELIQKRDIGTVVLTGQNDMDERQVSVDKFQNDPETKVFVANMKAAGVGLNLTAASIVIFADMDWSPEIHNQAMDRAHRIGQKGTVNVYFYVMENTIEEDIIDILQRKQEAIGTLTGGETTIQAFMTLIIDRVGKTHLR